MASDLRALVNLISQSVDTIERRCAALGTDFPRLDEPFTPQSETVHEDPDIAKAVALIGNAAYQLGVTTRPAVSTALAHAGMSYNAAALRTANELHIPDILRPVGTSGLNVTEIAKITKTDANKLSRVLRFLASQGIFKEVKPDVFANNRISSTLCKGQDAGELFSSPDKLYDRPEASLSALIGHITDEGAKSATYLYEAIVDPEFAFSGDVKHCAIQKALGTDLALWEFLELPANKYRLHRMGFAMQGGIRIDRPEILINGFDWSTLPNGGTFVDVGGGLGYVSMALARAQPKLKIVVQDRPSVVADGLKLCEEHHKDIYSSGRVTYQAHDFFQPQPIKDASMFFLKRVIHDWSDEFAAKILRRLREAAQPHTKLLVMDVIIPYVSRASDDVPAVPGLIKEVGPEPLCVNVGAGDAGSYFADLTMLALVNGQERTIAHLLDLFLTCGWKITRVYQLDGSGQLASLIEAVPV